MSVTESEEEHKELFPRNPINGKFVAASQAEILQNSVIKSAAGTVTFARYNRYLLCGGT
jgi:hypothetical protein